MVLCLTKYHHHHHHHHHHHPLSHCQPSSGKVSRPSLFLDFNLFYDILDFSLLSDPFASFSISPGNSWRTSFRASLCSKFLFYFLSLPKSAPCHIVGSIQWSKTQAFRHIDMLLFIMSFIFPKALHPVWVLLLTSSKWL